MSELSLETILDQNPNIYSAVVVMSKRARQITDQQKLLIDQDKTAIPVPEAKESEDFDEVEIDREALLKEHRKLPKPTRVAIEEMLQKKIRYETTVPDQAG